MWILRDPCFAQKTYILGHKIFTQCLGKLVLLASVSLSWDSKAPTTPAMLQTHTAFLHTENLHWASKFSVPYTEHLIYYGKINNTNLDDRCTTLV